MRRVFSLGLSVVLLLSAGPMSAGTIPNWQAPATWTPPRPAGTTKTGLKVGLLGQYPALPFIPIKPCRLADTRSTSGFAGEWGPPAIMGGGTQRTFTITGRCDIPSGAQAVSFNFAVWAPVTRGDLRVFPAGGGTPTVSTLNWEAGILALANAAVVSLSAGGAITVQVDGPGTIDLFFDVNGYYSPDVSSSSTQTFTITSSGDSAIMATGAQAGVVGSGGFYGLMGASSGFAGVFGHGTGSAAGVSGESTWGQWGVRGLTTGGSGAGVFGENNDATDGCKGVEGQAGGAATVFGVKGGISASAMAGSAGVRGIGAATAGRTFGVLGESYNSVADAAGVLGRDGTGINNPALGSFSAGVRGEGKTGVLGISSADLGAGVGGVYLDPSTGGMVSLGYLGGSNVGGYGYSVSAVGIGLHGYAFSPTGVTYGVKGVTNSTSGGAAGVVGVAHGVSFTDTGFGSPAGVLGKGLIWGVLGNASDTSGRGVQGNRVNSSTGEPITGGVLGYLGNSGVHSFNDITAVGLKLFVEPHPIDPARQIGFVAMEGPEAGTYFRGRGRLQGKTAVIVVPEAFRLVTEEESLTVQITPIGRAASVGVLSVLSMDLTQVVVEGQSDVEFSYLVQGVRKNYRNFDPIQANAYFIPAGPGARMDPWPVHIQRRLVETGVYHEDGTVNMQTAERMGWALKWREAEQIRQQAISRAPEGLPQSPKP